ncbi:MAG: gliding motility-associated-like protein [Halieaceae bacterium]|jgi:gliding motility-associated-like protein
MKQFLLALLYLFIAFAGSSQCASNLLNLGPDTTVCIGSSQNFSAGSGFLTYQWNTGSTSSTISVNTPGSYSCQTLLFNPIASNLVSNGDFSLGNTLFTSSYVYGTGGSWGLLSNPGQYAISTNANLTHNNFPSCTDHTTGAGNYMIMNGSSVANTNVWCQTISVSPNTSYVFSSWFTSVDPGSPAQLNLTVDGTAIGAVFNLSASTCSWVKYERIFTSGAAQTSAVICIRSQSSAAGGNDFAVDDIVFSAACVYSDTVVLSTDTIPIVNLGADTNMCNGSTLTLDATDDPTFDYLWSSGANTAITTLNSSHTNLMVTVTNGHCSSTDAINVLFSSQPLVDLGNDTTLCPGGNLVLDMSWPSASYLWSDNSTSNMLAVNSAGQYWVQVSDICGVAYDTINISYLTFPLVDLGADTSICDGEIVVLNAIYPGASYTWNGGTSDSVLSVTATGQYSVNVQVGSCIDRDTIQVSVNPYPLVSLGSDTVLCVGQSYIVQVNNQGATYLWNDGALGAAKNIVTAGTYWVNVSIGNCQSSDTLIVDMIDYPIADLPSDSFACEGDNIIFDVTQNNVTYLWNDNSTNPTLSISQSAQVWVEVSNFCGVDSDTTNIYVNPYPIVNLGNDTSICDGESLTKDVFNVGGVYDWSDGTSLQAFEFTSSGIYSVTVTSNFCATADTFNLTVFEMPDVNLGVDTLICIKAIYEMTVIDSFDSIYWMDGSTESTYIVQESGAQWVEVTNEICKGSDTVWVSMENCETYVEMPNVFTPNEDGVNEVFSPIYTVGIIEMHTTIFDRWGKVVFETNNPKINWNGTNKGGEKMPDGVYFWTADIIGIDAENYAQNGTVTFIGN